MRMLFLASLVLLAACSDDGDRSPASPSSLTVVSSAVPEGAVLTAELRRPIGAHEFASVAFAAQGEGEFISLSQVPAGRWTMRLTITADGEQWLQESEI